jgi:hypothetical protein
MEVLSWRDLTVGGYFPLLLSLFLSAGYTAPMPKPNRNGQSKPKKVPRLTANDLCALRDFVNKRFTEPSSLQDNNPLPLSVLIEQNPDLYRNAVDLLSAGNSVQAVAHASSIPLQTIRAMTYFIPDYRLIVREATARNLSQSSLRMSEVLLERADKMPIDRVPFALAVSTEKAELLSGGVTARSETRQIVTREELQKLFDALPRAKGKVVQLPDPTPPQA